MRSKRVDQLIVAGLAVAVCALPVFAAHDKFNRADLGPRWVVSAGSLYIVDNAFRGDDQSIGFYDKKPVRGDRGVSIKVTLDPSLDVEYGAIAIGDITAGNNIFVKIQSQNGGGTFDTAAFYVGNNGGGSFFTLDSLVPSPARLTVSVRGSLATMAIESATDKRSYPYDYGNKLGAGPALGTFGKVALDNFKLAYWMSNPVVQPRRVTQSDAVDRSR